MAKGNPFMEPKQPMGKHKEPDMDEMMKGMSDNDADDKKKRAIKKLLMKKK